MIELAGDTPFGAAPFGGEPDEATRFGTARLGADVADWENIPAGDCVGPVSPAHPARHTNDPQIASQLSERPIGVRIESFMRSASSEVWLKSECVCCCVV